MSERTAPGDPSIDRVTMMPPDGKAVDWAGISSAARRHATSVAGTGPIVNLCEDRLTFLVLLLAAALAQRATILPSDRSPGSLRNIFSAYDSLTACYDSEEMANRLSATGSHGVFFRPIIGDADPRDGLDPATIEDAKIVIFTSGSTGKPVSCVRTLTFFRRGADANAECMMDGLAPGAGIVATVPPYHMYGFELSVIVPLFRGGTVYSGRPFYPRDIADALQAVVAPRILISTPVHLRILKESGIEIPPVARVFSATAPLPGPLAADIEGMLGADLREIFGTTETGSIGWRNTAREESFHLLHGMILSQEDETSRISASHISPPFVLPDRLVSSDGGAFRIAGRSNDIVNIAGKRMSLAGMNAILAEIDGVMDGAFLAPGDDADGPVNRMIAFVAAPGLSTQDIKLALRNRLDSAFIPRRVIFVEALPRNAAGKLPLHRFRRFALATLARQDGAERITRFAAEELFFADHFPDNPIVPGAVLLGEAIDFLDESLGGTVNPIELVNARFPESARPGIDCLFRLKSSADDQFRIECVQGGKVVMKAALRVEGEAGE